jgi:hypothetical protein
VGNLLARVFFVAGGKCESGCRSVSLADLSARERAWNCSWPCRMDNPIPLRLSFELNPKIYGCEGALLEKSSARNQE